MAKYKFTEDDEIKGETFNFTNIGDKIYGTYVGKRQIPDPKKPNQVISLYEIKTDDGVYVVWDKPIINQAMKFVRYGQIVEMELVATKPSRFKANPLKIIKVRANKNVVDEEWIAEQEEIAMGRDEKDEQREQGIQPQVNSGDGEIKVDEIPFKDKAEDAQPTLGTTGDIPGTVDEQKALIEQLAKEKLGVSNDADIMKTVMEKTQLAFIATNYPGIIEKLQNL